MKFKNLIVIFLFMLTLPAYAGMKNFPYKELPEGGKAAVSSDGVWSLKVSKKTPFYKKSDTLLIFSDTDTSFNTDCNFIFMDKGRLLGYSQNDLKFYEIKSENGILQKDELPQDEVSLLFKDFKIVGLSEFTKTTNVYKYEYKHSPDILLYNDTGETFGNYTFSTGNSKIDTYPINSMLKIKKKGMIQFSSADADSKNSPWYVILAR